MLKSLALAPMGKPWVGQTRFSGCRVSQMKDVFSKVQSTTEPPLFRLVRVYGRSNGGSGSRPATARNRLNVVSQVPELLVCAALPYFRPGFHRGANYLLQFLPTRAAGCKNRHSVNDCGYKAGQCCWIAMFRQIVL